MRVCHRYSDEQARELAVAHLRDCVDCGDAEVCWDADHHLQGHLDLDGHHLVVIASRDDAHAPLVLSEADWDALRRGQLVG